MAAKLEGIIRPFEAGDVFTAQLLPPVEPNNVALPPINVFYGNPITLQMAAIGITNLYGGVKLKERSRTTTTQRVSNPNDATQFVDVQKILTMTMTDENKQDHTFTFNQ